MHEPGLDLCRDRGEAFTEDADLAPRQLGLLAAKARCLRIVIVSEVRFRREILAEFLERVSDGLMGMKPISSIDAARSVFSVLERHLAKGQALKVRNALPEEVRALWPEDVLAERVL